MFLIFTAGCGTAVWKIPGDAILDADVQAYNEHAAWEKRGWDGSAEISADPPDGPDGEGIATEQEARDMLQGRTDGMTGLPV